MDFFDDNNEEINIKRVETTEYTLNRIYIGECIQYDSNSKRFVRLDGKSEGYIPMGVCINFDVNNGLTDVLYKGFFYQNPIIIPQSLHENYIPVYVNTEFNKARKLIIDKMPRIKKLKRINFKLPTRTQLVILYNNFDKIMEGYSLMFGNTAMQMMKASIVTTPFYADYDGVIKVYKFETNEYYDCDNDGANFMSCFSFNNFPQGTYTLP